MVELWILDKIREAIDDVHLVTNARFAPDFERWAKGKGVIVHDDGTETNETRLGAIGDIRFVQQSADLDDDLLVVAGDNLFDYSLLDYIAFWRARPGSSALAVYDVDVDCAKQYGIVILDEDDRIVGFVEKQADPPTTLSATATYLYAPGTTRPSSGPTSKEEIQPTSPGTSSPGSTGGSRSTDSAPPAAPSTSGSARASCSRPTTACGRARGFPFAVRISWARVRPWPARRGRFGRKTSAGI